MFFIHVMMCSQADNNIIDAEKQARIMILQSAQAIQELDKLLDCKRQEKDAACNIMKLHQAHKDFYEQQLNEPLSVVPYDVLAPQLNYYQLNMLEKLSLSDVILTQFKITALHNMSAADQLKYVCEHAKDCNVDNPAELLEFLERKLTEHKNVVQNSIHAARLQQRAHVLLGMCAVPMNNIKHQQKIFETLSQDEDDVRDYRYEYQQINNELKDLWYGDGQAARTDRWAQVTRKLLQQDAINSARKQHRFLQSFMNEKIIAIGRVKSAERKQAKKECNLMATEECAMQNIVEDIMLQVIDRQDLFDREDQSLRAIAQQKKQEAAKQAKKEKDKAKKQRQKQTAKEKIAKELEERCEQAAHEERMQKIKERHQCVLGNVERLHSEECAKILHIDLAQGIQTQSNNHVEHELLQQTKESYKDIDCDYQDFYIAMQANKPSQDGDNITNDHVILYLLQKYADAVCDSDLTDKKIATLTVMSEILADHNQRLKLENKRMSWYSYLDKNLYRKISNRYLELLEKYNFKQSIFNNEFLLERNKSQCIRAQKLLDECEVSLSHVMRELKAMKSRNASEDEQRETKDIMLGLLKQKEKYTAHLSQCKADYETDKNTSLEIDLYKIMLRLQDFTGILNAIRLGSPIDFSRWEESSIGKDVLQAKFQDIKSNMVDKINTELYYFVESSLNNFLKELGFSLKDSTVLSKKMRKYIVDAIKIPKDLIDFENVEYYTHKMHAEYNYRSGNQYTLAQINDATQLQLMFIKHFTHSS